MELHIDVVAVLTVAYRKNKIIEFFYGDVAIYKEYYRSRSNNCNMISRSSDKGVL